MISKSSKMENKMTRIFTKWSKISSPNKVGHNPFFTAIESTEEYRVSPVNDFKPKKSSTRKNSPNHIVFILDGSSSMENQKEKTISGFNEFLDIQRKSETKTFVSLYTFNGTSTQAIFKNKDISNVHDLTDETYRVSGCTNLNDAIGDVMCNVNKQLARKKKKDRPTVAFVILTDGQENSSKRFFTHTIKNMISMAQEKMWSFTFLGADLDAFSISEGYGISNAATLSYGKNSSNMAFASASRFVSRQSGDIKSGMTLDASYASSAYTDAERKLSK